MTGHTPSATPPPAGDGCPECDGRLQARSDEVVCQQCGLVVDGTPVDYGPEWRSYSDDTDTDHSRVGAPRTHTRHDHGLSTEIGHKRDAHGQELSPRKQRRLARLRSMQHRARFRSSKERNLGFALGEINRMQTALGLPDAVAETAGQLFRHAHDAAVTKGRALEAVAAAVLYAAARLHDQPRTLARVQQVSRLDDDARIYRAYNQTKARLDLAVPLITPRALVPQVVDALEIVDPQAAVALREHSESLLQESTDATELRNGRAPHTLAAASVYIAARADRLALPQWVVAEAADTTPVSLRSAGRELAAATAGPDWDDLPTATQPPRNDIETAPCSCGCDRQFASRRERDGIDHDRRASAGAAPGDDSEAPKADDAAQDAPAD